MDMGEGAHAGNGTGDHVDTGDHGMDMGNDTHTGGDEGHGHSAGTTSSTTSTRGLTSSTSSMEGQKMQWVNRAPLSMYMPFDIRLCQVDEFSFLSDPTGGWWVMLYCVHHAVCATRVSM